MEVFLCWAQLADPVSGGAGWVGAGLLGAVLSWLLLVHLPSKDKQLKEMITYHAGQIDIHRREFMSAMTTVTTTFAQEISAERQGADKRTSLMMEFFEKRARASAVRKGVVQ